MYDVTGKMQKRRCQHFYFTNRMIISKEIFTPNFVTIHQEILEISGGEWDRVCFDVH